MMTAYDPATYAELYRARLDALDTLNPMHHQNPLRISKIGVCREQMRRDITNPQPAGRTSMSAIIGTAVHDTVERATNLVDPHVRTNVEVTLTLNVRGKTLTLVGHADDIDPTEPSVTDTKTADGLSLARRTGSDDQQRFQRMCYAEAAIQSAVVQRDGLVVRNVWVDRSGRENEVHVEQEPYDPRVVEAARQWLEDVDYAVDQRQEASKDKPSTWCEQFCVHYADCRGAETTTGEVITDPVTAVAAQLMVDTAPVKKTVETEREDARRALIGLNGIVEREGRTFLVRTTVVNPVDRESYQKLAVKEVA